MDRGDWIFRGIIALIVAGVSWSAYSAISNPQPRCDGDWNRNWAQNQANRSMEQTLLCLRGEPSELANDDCQADRTISSRYALSLRIAEDECPSD